MTVWQDMQAALDAMAEGGLRREPAVLESACGPKVTVGSRQVVCLCSNDYLSLASEPHVTAAATRAVAEWGLGAGASRLVSGSFVPHVELERRLAEFKRAEAAVVTSTGWMANRVAIAALARPGDLILCDKLDHASILDASFGTGATVRTFAHRRVRRAEQLLQRHRARHKRCLIVTDSLFSMDGDLAPLAELARLKERYDAQLLIDEAHATGVLGAAGRGAAELLGVEDSVDATVGTLSKALGALGGFVAGPRVLIDTIRNTGRAFIYTTAPPPAICAAAACALDIVGSQPHRRRQLLEMAERFRKQLADAGLSTGDSAAQIVPVLIGPAGKALTVSRKLFEAGFLIPAIRPPTVPPGTSRLRISLTAGHQWQDLARLVQLLAEIVVSSSGEHTGTQARWGVWPA